MVLVAESKTIKIDSQASILARTWFYPFKQELTECGVCLPELVEKDFTYFLLGALAGVRPGKIDSLRKNRPQKTYKEALKVIFSLLCPKFLRAKGKSRFLFAGNPKIFRPLMAATRGIYFEKILGLSWLKEFKRLGVCQRGWFDYFKIGDLLHAFKLKARLKNLGRKIEENGGLDDKLKPAVDYLLNTHFPKLASYLYAIERMLKTEKPNWVLVDEDRTEEKRMLVALARNRGIKSAVLMHGAPTRSIGYAPLYADHFITWGSAYLPKLIEWGIPSSKIIIGGSPYHEEILKKLKGRERPLKQRYQIPPLKKVILLALNIYRDSPSEDLQGQSMSKAQMRLAFDTTVSRLKDEFLIVKPHPRDRNKSKINGWVRDCRNPNIVYSESDIFELISISDFVLSPGSTVLLDALYFGKTAVILDLFNLPWFDYMDDTLFLKAKNSDELDSILLGERKASNVGLEKYFANRSVERIRNFIGIPRV